MGTRSLETRAGLVEIGPVDPERTYLLRQQVLRPHQSIEEMSLMGSSRPGAVAVGAVLADGGEVVGTAAVAPEDPPELLGEIVPERPAWRLRSMATKPELRGEGIGGLVLETAVQHVVAQGGALLWCNARIPARRFYERSGFTAVGEEWVEPDIGPHVVMYRVVNREGKQS